MSLPLSSDPTTVDAATANDTTTAPAVGRGYRSYVLTALSVVGFMCAVDKVVISMFVEPIRKEFALTDTQLGLMTGLAFAVLGGIAAIPLARWADRGSRKLIIVGSFVAWTVFTALSGVAVTFGQLLAVRMSVGIGEAGCVPATHSMLGDYYPRAERPHALGVHSAGTYLGLLGGLLGGGILVQTVGWRAGFVWLGVLGLVMAAIVQFTVREPVRIDAATADAPRVSLRAGLGDLHAFAWLVMAFSTTALAGWSILAWLPSYFERAFALPPIQIGLGLGLCIGVATALGSIAGGRLGVRYARDSRTWGAGFAAACCAVVTPVFIASFHVPAALPSFALLFIAFALAGMIMGPVFSTLQDLVAPGARATAVAVVGLAGTVVGQGVGPLLIGALSDALGVGAGGGAPDADSLRWAMTIVATVNFLSVLAFWRLSRRIAVLPVPASAPVGG